MVIGLFAEHTKQLLLHCRVREVCCPAPVEAIQSPSATVIDRMRVIQKMIGCELKSSQEEADSWLLLNAPDAEESGSTVVVVSAEHTDVLILCLGFSSNFQCSLYQKCKVQRIELVSLTSQG